MRCARIYGVETTPADRRSLREREEFGKDGG
jgi:hypothetical protein